MFVYVDCSRNDHVESMDNDETATDIRPRRNISEIKNKQRRAEAFRQMKREQKKVYRQINLPKPAYSKI